MCVVHAVDVALVDVEQTRIARVCFFRMLGICTASLDASADFCDSRLIQAPRRKLVPVMYD